MFWVAYSVPYPFLVLVCLGCVLYKWLVCTDSGLLVVETRWTGDKLYQTVVFWVLKVFFLGIFGVFWVFFL